MSGRQRVGEEGWALLQRTSELRLAGVLDGRPAVRTMHHGVADGRIWLHGAPRSTVGALAGSPVQLLAEEIVVRIPSWMRDPVRACPATTFYRSVLADGELVAVEDAEVRAEALQRMMTLRQPEGRHRPIDASDPVYAAAVRGLAVWAVEPRSLSVVDRLGQHLPADEIERIVRALWRRGAPGDLAGIEAIVRAHPSRPRFAEIPDLPEGARVRCAPDDADAVAAAALVQERYWNGGQSPLQLQEAVRSSSAWVGIEIDGRLVATARAISDRSKRCWIYDVAVDDLRQRTGLGTILLGLLLDHPAVRGTEIHLATRDAAPFYVRFGFEGVHTFTDGPYPRILMRRPRPERSG